MTMRRCLLLIFLLVSWCAQAWAQNGSEMFMEMLEQYAERRDVNGAVKLIVSRADLVPQAFVFSLNALPSADPQDRPLVIWMLNVMARTAALTGTRDYSDALQQQGLLFPEQQWANTVLAGGTSAARPPTNHPTSPATGSAASGHNGHWVPIFLSTGNFYDAGQACESELKSRPGAARARQLRRLKAACALGMGLPLQALREAEALLQEQADAHETLATRLLACHAACLSERSESLKSHASKAQGLAALEPGAYGRVARFLSLSYLFEVELLAHPDLPIETIVARHQAAWKELNGLGQLPSGELDSFSSELWWLGDVHFRVWVQTLGTMKLDLDAPEGTLADERLRQITSESSAVLVREGGPLSQKRHFALSLTNLALLEVVINSDISSGQSARIERARSTLGQLEKVLETYEKGFTQLSQQFSGKAPGDPLRGRVSALLARRELLRAQLAVADKNSETAQAALRRATSYSAKGDDLNLALDVLLIHLDYLEKLQPPAWQETADVLLADLARNPAVAESPAMSIQLHYQRGRLRLAQGRSAEAVPELRRAVELLERNLRETGSDKSADNLRRYARQFYETLAEAELKQNQGAAALETLGRGLKIDSLQSLALKTSETVKRLPEAGRKLVLRAEQKRNEVRVVEQELAQLKASGADAAAQTKASQLLAQTRKDYYQVVSELEKSYPEFKKLDIKPMNFTKLQRSLPADLLVVQYFPTRDSLYLMEASSEKVVVRSLPVAKAQIDQAVQEFRQCIVRFQAAGGSNPADSERIRKALAQLHAYLIEPLAGDLAGKKNLAVIPYGSLMYVPYAALAPQSKPYLVESVAVVTLCKSSDLEQLFGPPAARTGGLVALGNPDGTLPAAAQEVEALKQIFPESQVYLAGAATSEVLDRVRAPQISYLHLATHGVLNSQEPRRSYLTFAKSKLAIPDIAGFRLDGQGADLNLVTLSACETALAERDPSGSELRTIADAFSFAGCRSVVASLWSVEDGSTRDLMVEFYKQLKAGKGKAEALQAAQQSLLKQDRSSHPFFWAPFVLLGDWR